MKLESKFTFGDVVRIDGGSVNAFVIGFAFYPHDVTIQVSWWNNGELKEQWVAKWRLVKVDHS